MQFRSHFRATQINLFLSFSSRTDPSSITKRALPPVPAPSVEQVQSSAEPARLPPPPLPLIEGGGGGVGNRPVSADDGWTGTPVVVDGDDAVAPAGKHKRLTYLV